MGRRTLAANVQLKRRCMSNEKNNDESYGDMAMERKMEKLLYANKVELLH